MVVANAGMMSSKHKLTADGHEQVLQVNAYSTGFLALLLLPILAKTAVMPVPPGGAVFKPRMVIVASEGESIPQQARGDDGLTCAVHYWTKTPFVDLSQPIIPYLDEEKHFAGLQEQYNISKLFDVMIARQLAKLPIVQSGKITVCTANPGAFTHSSLVTDG